jgi:enoyl-CoA hydratase
MEFQNLVVEIDGPVATITLNRPAALNSLSGGLMDDYAAALAALNKGDAVRVIRLRGAGRAFCTGYDISGPGKGDSAKQDGGVKEGSGARADADADADAFPVTAPVPAEPHIAHFGEGRAILEREFLRERIEYWLRLWNYRKPVIAQVHGYCLSGGLDLLATTDITFAAAGTRFGHPAARGVGIPLLLGMLPLKVGASRTKRILFTGDLIEAAEAREWGLVDFVESPDELDAATARYCQRVAMQPLDSLSIHKHVTNRWMEIMGARLGSYEGAEFDTLYHTSPVYGEFVRRIVDGGLKTALAWRDDPYKATPDQP